MTKRHTLVLAAWLLAVVTAPMVVSCATGDPAVSSGPTSGDSLATQLDTQVVLHGVARDAKGGAVVLMLSGGVVYIEGLTSWPEEKHGKPVTVSGVLRLKKYLPDPHWPDGTIVQGAEGEQYVLENPQIAP
jgi:hypothetical protein